MSAYRPLRTVLFFYELFRLFFVTSFFTLLPSLGGAEDGSDLFPALAYAAANALFPLMTLFLWLNPREYRTYLPLYLAGKVIALIAFAAWALFSLWPALTSPTLAPGSLSQALPVLSGSCVLSLADLLSLPAGWALHRKLFPRAAVPAYALPSDSEGAD